LSVAARSSESVKFFQEDLK
jgi:hypothetical protein